MENFTEITIRVPSGTRLLEPLKLALGAISIGVANSDPRKLQFDSYSPPRPPMFSMRTNEIADFKPNHSTRSESTKTVDLELDLSTSSILTRSDQNVQCRIRNYSGPRPNFESKSFGFKSMPDELDPFVTTNVRQFWSLIKHTLGTISLTADDRKPETSTLHKVLYEDALVTAFQQYIVGSTHIKIETLKPELIRAIMYYVIFMMSIDSMFEGV